jgi:hypothetical protein
MALSARPMTGVPKARPLERNCLFRYETAAEARKCVVGLVYILALSERLGLKQKPPHGASGASIRKTGRNSRLVCSCAETANPQPAADRDF